MEPRVDIKKEPLGKGLFINVSKNHTFGTDAVLLADFAADKISKMHCDLGMGCGIISMLLIREEQVSSSVGVDISSEAVELARITAEEFSKGKFTPILADLSALKGVLPYGEYDLVTCNPPYKAEGTGIISQSSADKIARHETACSLEDVIKTASHLLKSSGRVCICQRPERLSDIIDLMRKYRCEPKRLRMVCKKKETEPWLVLVEGKRDAKSGLRILPSLFVYDEDGSLSKEMIEIYGDYKEGHI